MRNRGGGEPRTGRRDPNTTAEEELDHDIHTFLGRGDHGILSRIADRGPGPIHVA